jgi:hypothetical protein
VRTVPFILLLVILGELRRGGLIDWRGYALLVACIFVLFLTFTRRPRFSLWRLGSRTRGFLLASNWRFVLRYDPRLKGEVDPAEVLRQADEALEDVRVTLFGPEGRDPRSLFATPSLQPAQVTVFLFRTPEEYREVFGEEVGACALPLLHAVAAASSGYPLAEALRHQLTHLFTCRPWNRSTPPLLSEGLPTWLQQTWDKSPVDRLAAASIARGQGELRPLLNRREFFHAGQEANSYAMAGSFSGYLLRRFGREAYLRFYNEMYDGRRFDAKFVSNFGQTFEEAELAWRQEVVRECDQPVGAGTV